MKYIFTIGLLSLYLLAFGQNQKLANEYFLSGEYEKSASMYLELWQKSKKQEHLFNRYIQSLTQLESFDEAEKVIRGRVIAEPKNVAILVQLAQISERKGNTEEAARIYDEALEKLGPDARSITLLGSAFQRVRKYERALATYEKGNVLMKDSLRFVVYQTNLAERIGEPNDIIKYALRSLIKNSKNSNRVKSQFQRKLKKESHPLLQTSLYQYMANFPDNNQYPELLQWSFMQLHDYKNALRQARSLDRKLEENGSRVFKLAQDAANHKDYDAAIKAYQYITNKKSKSGNYYLASKSEILKIKKKKYLSVEENMSNNLDSLEREYISFLDDYGRNSRTAYVILDLARYQNKYLKDETKAINTLKELIKLPGIERVVLANAKMELGDLYLLTGDRWESTLLYSQVDKDFKEEGIGERARYLNARLSYFVGDFEWAQEQFDILMASTSKLIANDAIDRSVFITDNLGLDTTPIPMQIFANAELKIFQRRYTEAFSALDKLLNTYPKHGLEDDVYYVKANVYREQGKDDQAIALYEKIVANFPEDIRTDNSLFALAEIYENNIGDKKKAQEYYEQIFIEYSNSTFSIDARKRYRRMKKEMDEVISN